MEQKFFIAMVTDQSDFDNSSSKIHFSQEALDYENLTKKTKDLAHQTVKTESEAHYSYTRALFLNLWVMTSFSCMM